MTPRPAPATPHLRGSRLAYAGLAPLALAVVAGSVGCYRATGQARPTTVAEQIPATGGDRVAGNKATAGPGDYYLGNDYIEMAVDGAAYGSAKGQFGAPSGGAILDIGGVALDTAYNRVSMPTDNLESLAPVVNQDPDLRLAFDRYHPENTTDLVTLTMQGYLLDPLHKLAGASWDSDGKVQGVTVVHTITLGSHDSFFTLKTVLTNGSGAALPIQSLGDYLHQRGGGFRFVIPANQDANGNPLATWGLDIPGSDFTQPLDTSVRASLVALQGAEPSSADTDSHQSLGILPLNEDQVLVASDTQSTLGQNKPVFPSRLVVGNVPSSSSLAQGMSLSYSRRLYCIAGSTRTGGYPVESRGVMNEMIGNRDSLHGVKTGAISFYTNRTAAPRGYRTTEIRFERYTQDTTLTDPATDSNPTHWNLEWIGIPEAGELPDLQAVREVANLPAVPDPGVPGSFLPYRIVVKSSDYSTTSVALSVYSALGTINPPTLLRPDPGLVQSLVPSLSPEASGLTSSGGAVLTPTFRQQGIALRRSGEAASTAIHAFLPARLTVQGLDANGNLDPSKDPDSRRLRILAGTFSPIVKGKIIPGNGSGQYRFTAGNEAFSSNLSTLSNAATLSIIPGLYRLYVSHGPLNPIVTSTLRADDYLSPTALELVMDQLDGPTGWRSFDVPGPSQATTGGMLPAEQLSSALAGSVSIVGRTESDKFGDGAGLRKSFRSEFFNSGDAATDTAHLAVIKGDPFVVNARSSSIGEGTFTSLFTPGSNQGLPFGGALPSDGWSAADFIGQGGGKFVIANRPRGPQGLFTAHPVAAGVPLGTGANSWWDDTDALANGHRTGDFDAIELLRAEGCNPADPSAWFAEFKTVRSDWFNLLNLETPTNFTKGLGLSSGVYSLDTPVGLSRTYLKLASTLNQDDLSPVADALKSGAAVASTGPLLDVAAGTQGPGGFLTGTNPSVTLTANLWFATWIPVDEIRVVVNGAVVQTLHLSDFTQDAADARHWSASITVPVATYTGGTDGWIVVEAGVPLSTSGAYAAGTPWNKIMKGIYPVAVTNPIFVDVDGGGYTAPL